MTLNIAIVLITLLVSFILMAMEVTTPNAVILCALALSASCRQRTHCQVLLTTG